MLPWFKPFKILLIQGFKGISNYFQDGILEMTVLAVYGYGIYATAYMVHTQQFFSWGLKLIVIYWLWIHCICKYQVAEWARASPETRNYGRSDRRRFETLLKNIFLLELFCHCLMISFFFLFPNISHHLETIYIAPGDITYMRFSEPPGKNEVYFVEIYTWLKTVKNS